MKACVMLLFVYSPGIYIVLDAHKSFVRTLCFGLWSECRILQTRIAGKRSSCCILVLLRKDQIVAIHWLYLKCLDHYLESLLYFELFFFNTLFMCNDFQVYLIFIFYFLLFFLPIFYVHPCHVNIIVPPCWDYNRCSLGTHFFPVEDRFSASFHFCYMFLAKLTHPKREQIQKQCLKR